jgi:arylsulfatase A-like enzyme
VPCHQCIARVPPRSILAVVLLGAAAGGLCRAVPAAEQTAARPAKNVLFIVSDDLNTMLGCYGDPLAKTPRIDALAARGTLFERAYCAFPLCGPSRNSFLTGLHPNATGIFGNGQVFRQTIPDHPSLPELFRRHGGFAARVGKLYHYNVPGSIGTAGHDDPASWEATFNPAGVDRLEEEPRIFTLLPGQFGGTLSWYASLAPDERHTDGLVARQAEHVLGLCAADRSRPFFLAVGFFRPHTPYVAPKDPYFALHPREEMPVVTGIAEDQADLPAAALGSHKAEQDKLTDDLRRECRQAYTASISFMDAQLGRVLAAIDRLGLADDTVIVFTSDHGYHMGEHGLWQKMSLFEESTRVPLLIVAPGVSRPGGRVAAPVSQVDLYPTLAALCGLAAPANLQGQSLVPMLRDPAVSGRGWAVTQVVRGGGKSRPTVTVDKSSDDPRYVGYTLRTPRWRYTEWDEGRKGVELYDHDSDPQELQNLGADPAFAGDRESLAKLLHEAIASTLPPGGVPPELRPGTWAPVIQVR